MVRPRTSTTPVTSVAGVVACVGAVVLLVLLAAWAASGGGEPTFRGAGDPAPTERATTPSPTADEDEREADGDAELRERERQEPPGWARVVSVVLQVAAALAVLYLLVRLVRSAARNRAYRRRDDPEAPPEPPEVLEPRRLAEAIDADATEQRALLLAGGPPGDAIVACWHRFELQAERARLARLPWETSTEFVERLLGLVEIDGQVVDELARLYREARHSDHVLGEDERRRAAAALQSVHAQVRARRPAVPEAR